MKDFKSMNLWDLVYSLDQRDSDLCSKIDPFLADAITSLNDLNSIEYSLRYKELSDTLVLTKKKINCLFKDELEESESHDSILFSIQRFSSWLGDELKESIANIWLNDDVELNSYHNVWIADWIPSTSDTQLRVLNKLINIYKKKRSKKNIKLIEKAFDKINKDNLDGACELLASSSHVVSSTLLQRDDISGEYVIKGLRSLSKLSKQREISGSIDLSKVKHLGPKGRLDVMKQLMGMNCVYYKYKQEQKNNNNNNRFNSYWTERRLQRRASKVSWDFSDIPSREEIKHFLFPCLVHHSEDVALILDRFDELVKEHKEKE